MASMSTTVVNPEHFAPITETEEKELRRVFEQLSDYAIKAPFLKERENLEKWLAENKSKSHGVSEDLVIETTRRLEEINAEIRKYEAVPYNDKSRKISTADVLEKMQELKLARPRRRETEESDGTGDSARVKKVSRRGVEEMVWEVDENLDGFLDWQEFKLMFNRNITDRTGLEPSRMVRFITDLICGTITLIWHCLQFNLSQFLIYDSKSHGCITVDETMHLLYARYSAIIKI